MSSKHKACYIVNRRIFRGLHRPGHVQLRIFSSQDLQAEKAMDVPSGNGEGNFEGVDLLLVQIKNRNIFGIRFFFPIFFLGKITPNFSETIDGR